MPGQFVRRRHHGGLQHPAVLGDNGLDLGTFSARLAKKDSVGTATTSSHFVCVAFHHHVPAHKLREWDNVSAAPFEG